MPGSCFTEDVVLLDGGLGTHLRALGAEFNGDPLWASKAVLVAPDLVRRAHYDFYHAGADVAITATYQASLTGFAKIGLSPSNAHEAVALAINLAAEARQLDEDGDAPACSSAGDERENEGPEARTPEAPSTAGKGGFQEVHARDADRPRRRRNRKIFVSNGSYGSALGGGAEYRGNYGVSEEVFHDYHRWRLQAALELEHLVDGVVFETLPESAEAKAIVSLLREFPSLRGKTWISFTCKSPTQLANGEDFRSAVADVLKLDGRDCYISGIGVNCLPVSTTVPLLCSPPLRDSLAVSLEKSRDPWNLHVVCYPNNEGARNAAATSAKPESPEVCQELVHGAAPRECDLVDRTTASAPTKMTYLAESAPDGQCGHATLPANPSSRDFSLKHPLASQVSAWLKGGVSAVGGCCGTSPEDVKEIGAVLENLRVR
ncbi:GJ17676, related [Neospora caninum Liverpool]|uniref:GJ17676, related n=1 Tax=Neospora caninum (strain Liverpool) TaxID=572307 RepID=F0VH67_NEOCL|nr:GJ17676, related [Neospora caninum Liverpool]CBZ53061.1 GJ17676, related [Neospora caninum Liverpool]CEL67044.1 TPA: GJ17676, related [Neospora caninum Liverpool]|eukprot:XP_003883093.1 GJ17676, related [Neospora caninum Liverpool]